MDLEMYRNIKAEMKERKKATLHLQKIHLQKIHLVMLFDLALFCTFSDPSLLEMKS